MKRTILTIAICTVIALQMANAQKTWRLGVSTFKESFFYPSLDNFSGPYHPGVSVVADKVLKVRRNSTKLLSLEAGFYHHDYFQTGLFLLAGLNYAYPIKEKLVLRWGPRLGYLHTFSPTGIYERKNGEFQQVKDFGRPTGLAGVTLGMEYPIITMGSSETIDLFLDYQILVEGPFAPAAGVPVVPHTFIGLGLKTLLF